MRLAIIRQRYTPYGGAERFVEAALEALLERNVAISLYTREWPQTRLQLIEPVVCDPFFIGRLWRDWGFARAVCDAIGGAQADLVQSHERLTCCDVYRAGDGVHAVWLEERLRHASALQRLSVRTSLFHRYVLRAEARLFASPWLRAVICNSKMVRDEIRARFGVPEERLHVIYNAVDSEAFHPGLNTHRADVRVRHHIGETSTVFLLVGSGFARKGVAAAISAIAQLPPTTHLLVVGRDGQQSRYERLARRHGIADRVSFAGAQVDPKPYFGAADAFVLPTLYDPCPNAALEAMACALPVITSTKSGVAELLLERDAGLVCAADDTATLGAHMRALLDPAMRAHFGRNGRFTALDLTPSAMTLKLVLLYRDLLAESVAARRARSSAAQADAPVLRDVPSGLARRTEGEPSAVGSGAVIATPPDVLAPPAVMDAAAELPARDTHPRRDAHDAYDASWYAEREQAQAKTRAGKRGDGGGDL
jgi:UDP-glucose:(heptosyl)LPS alpha-1,3-glucosyltransferase